MLEFNIVIRSFQEIKDFICLATAQPFAVFVGNEGQMVDAKGFIGLACLDFSRPLTVRCNCDPDRFQNFRQQAKAFLAP